jgi:hypothetical protein
MVITAQPDMFGADPSIGSLVGIKVKLDRPMTAAGTVRDDLPLADKMVPEMIADDDGENAIVKSADDAWAAPGWRETALDYHKNRGDRVSIAPYAPENLPRPRRLMDDNVSLDRAWREPNGRPSGAAASTVEALMFGLRDGLAALPKNPERLRRLSELNAEQLKVVCRRVQNFNPEIATPWSSDEVAALITKWRELHARR